MARLIFVSGGCRSGKSDYALNHALSYAQAQVAEPVFLATCPKIDFEMDQRILNHQRARDPEIWRTVEEAYDLDAAIIFLGREGKPKSIVVDCLSLWVNNLMYRATLTIQGADQNKPKDISESEIEKKCEAILNATEDLIGEVYFVSSEVGLGLVPESSEGRRYRDLLGRVNQSFAKFSHEAVFLVSGLPLKLK